MKFNIHKIDAYTVHIIGGPDDPYMKDYRMVIQLKVKEERQHRTICYLRFTKENSGIEEKFQRISSPSDKRLIINITLPEHNYPYLIDILRNEGPNYFSYEFDKDTLEMGTKWYIHTGLEPVGDGEIKDLLINNIQ